MPLFYKGETIRKYLRHYYVSEDEEFWWDKDNVACIVFYKSQTLFMRTEGCEEKPWWTLPPARLEYELSTSACLDMQ